MLYRPSSFRKNAIALTAGAMIATTATFPAAAQQALAPQTIAAPASTVKTMSDVDCRVVGQLLKYQVEKYLDKLSDEFVTDLAKYVGSGCVGFANGKPYEIRVFTRQDDFSGAKILEIANSGKVSIQATGVVVTYPKNWPPADSATARPNNRRSEVTGAPVFANK